MAKDQPAMKRLACVLVFALVGSGAAEVIDLGSRRELFVDRWHESHPQGFDLIFPQIEGLLPA
jgi:hypothetical protein